MSRPEKGTPEYDLWITAIDISSDAPLEQGSTVTSAKVWWGHIHKLRETLEALGIDWRTAKRKDDEATQRARERIREASDARLRERNRDTDRERTEHERSATSPSRAHRDDA